MKNKNLIKISFTGDLIGELPYFLAVKKREMHYNFDATFKYLKDYLKDSDYVVGNLEGPVSNPIFGGYTNDNYSFNFPKSFLKTLKESHFDLLMTANNHCLDRGMFGLKSTIKNIKKYNMNYVGTSLNNNEKSYKIIEIDGVKIAFLAYTYGTNYSYNFYKLKKQDAQKVNLIKKQNSDESWKFNKINFYKDLFIKSLKMNVKDFIHYKSKEAVIDTNVNVVVIDENEKGEWKIDKKILRDSIEQTKEAINNSDIAIFMLHSGGQFNKEPGSFTKKIVEEINKTGVPLIISNHPHVVQKVEKSKTTLVTYSLGNLINSYKTFYYRKENMGEYSVILNAYINKKNKTIEKYTFSIMKSVECEDGYIIVCPVYNLINKEKNKAKLKKLMDESLIIYNRFSNKNDKDFINKMEYEL